MKMDKKKYIQIILVIFVLYLVIARGCTLLDILIYIVVSGLISAAVISFYVAYIFRHSSINAKKKMTEYLINLLMLLVMTRGMVFPGFNKIIKDVDDISNL